MDILTDTWENERKLMDLSTAEPEGYTFQQDDLCFVGIPVFEGRVPKLVVSRLKTLVPNGAQAVAVAVYGGRAVDDALLELTDVLTETGFRCGAAIEAVAEHSILHIYAQNRPDAQDTADLHQYAGKSRHCLKRESWLTALRFPETARISKWAASRSIPKEMRTVSNAESVPASAPQELSPHRTSPEQMAANASPACGVFRSARPTQEILIPHL